MGPLASVAGHFPALLAALILATDRKIVRRLREAGATTAAHAVPFDPPGPVGNARLRRMVTVGAVRKVGDGRYYLDDAGYRVWRTARRKRGLTVVGLMLALVTLMIFAGVIKVR